MEASARRVLVVANCTAATPTLLDEVKCRAQQGLASLALLIPNAPSKDHVDWTLRAGTFRYSSGRPALRSKG